MNFFIPVSQLRRNPAVQTASYPVFDQRQRPLRDLRISVLDRCNFRCPYCMPKAVFNADYPYLPQADLLTFEEISQIARVAVELGVEKIRITGGEPLLRKQIEKLIAQLALLRTPNNQKIDLALTTNGALLKKKAVDLRNAGLERLTVSLDAIDDHIFRKMNDVDFPVEAVLDGIRAAEEAGFRQIKINMVVQRGVNENQIIPLAKYFRHTGHILRFIEYMDVGCTNGWNLQHVLPSQMVLEKLQAVFPLTCMEPNYAGEVSQRWNYQDGAGEVGFISSVSQAFCHSCTRARLSTDGRLFTCLFANQGEDLRAIIRARAAEPTETVLKEKLIQIWQNRQDRYSEIRFSNVATKNKIEMSYIGG